MAVKPSSRKRTHCVTPSRTASKMARLGSGRGALSPIRRGGTPAGRNTLAANGNIPVRGAKNIRRCSSKAQKEVPYSRQHCKGKLVEKASIASTTAAGPVGEVTTIESFTQFLAQVRRTQLTSSILAKAPRPFQPDDGFQAMDSHLDWTQVPPP
ncbi:uncharacterized protein [Dermacentor andersoni]|uniref:uncharacterized protein n=1 Tax=Dermacentor andersoni TaxID=34620 RepID=UPI002415BE22|nr:uncharacterized protein LOC129384614 [Dermacentor andersoni]